MTVGKRKAKSGATDMNSESNPGLFTTNSTRHLYDCFTMPMEEVEDVINTTVQRNRTAVITRRGRINSLHSSYGAA